MLDADVNEALEKLLPRVVVNIFCKDYTPDMNFTKRLELVQTQCRRLGLAVPADGSFNEYINRTPSKKTGRPQPAKKAHAIVKEILREKCAEKVIEEASKLTESYRSSMSQESPRNDPMEKDESSREEREEASPFKIRSPQISAPFGFKEEISVKFDREEVLKRLGDLAWKKKKIEDEMQELFDQLSALKI